MNRRISELLQYGVTVMRSRQKIFLIFCIKRLQNALCRYWSALVYISGMKKESLHSNDLLQCYDWRKKDA